MSASPSEAARIATPDAPVGAIGGGWLAGLRRRRWIAAVLGLLPVLLPALLFLPVVLSPPLNHDVAAVLDFAQRWLNGEHLYSDLIDVNPPLIFVLNLLPAWLAWATPLDEAQALQTVLLGFGGFCWWLAQAARRRAAEGPAERMFLDVLPALVLLDAGYDFGQREHIMAIAALPYLLGAAARAEGERPRARLAAAVTAAIGFALKPHFLAIPLLVELVVVLGRVGRGPAETGSGLAVLRAAVGRSLRDPVPWAMALVWLTYLASFPLVFPDYLGVVVPLVWDYYLDLGGHTPLQVLLEPAMIAVLALLAPLLVAAFRRAAGALPRVLAVAAVGAFAAAFAQHKGWSYHILPIALFACGLGGVLAARWFDTVAGRMRATAARPFAAVLAGLFALYAVATGEAPRKELTYAGSPADGLTALLKQEAAGERVLVLSPGIYPIYPALNDADAHNTLRTMNLWLLQGAYRECLPDGRRYRQVWEMERPEFFVYRTVAEDFARAPPAAVVVDRQPGIPWCGAEFDFVAYFTRHPLFGEMWSHYQLAAEWDRYRIYTRKD